MAVSREEIGPRSLISYFLSMVLICRKSQLEHNWSIPQTAIGFLRFSSAANRILSGPSFIKLLSRNYCLANLLAQQNTSGASEFQQSQLDGILVGTIPSFCWARCFCTYHLFVVTGFIKLGPWLEPSQGPNLIKPVTSQGHSGSQMYVFCLWRP